MTDLVPRRPSFPDRYAPDAEAHERSTGMLIYGLYLASPLTAGISGLGGLLMAAGRSKRAASRLGSHFRYQVWTAGSALGAGLTGVSWGVLGMFASMADRTSGGGQLLIAGGVLATTSAVGFIAASVFGLSRLASHEPIGPEPR